jgi:hypothetical protein
MYVCSTGGNTFFGEWALARHTGCRRGGLHGRHGTACHSFADGGMHAWLHGAGSIIEIVLLPLSTALSYAAAAGVIYLLASLLTRSVPSHASTRDGEEGGTNNKRSHDVGVSLPLCLSPLPLPPLCSRQTVGVAGEGPRTVQRRGRARARGGIGGGGHGATVGLAPGFRSALRLPRPAQAVHRASRAPAPPARIAGPHV